MVLLIHQLESMEVDDHFTKRWRVIQIDKRLSF